MKTIETASEEYALSREDNDYTIETEMAFCAGVRFAQQWIPIEEELPEQSMNAIVNGMYQETGTVLYKTSNGKHGITSRIQFMDHGFYWKGSGTLQKSIISWRPIEFNL